MSAPTTEQAIVMLEAKTTELFKDFIAEKDPNDATHLNGNIVGIVESLVYLRHGVELTDVQFAAYMHDEYEAALDRYQNTITTGEAKP